MANRFFAMALLAFVACDANPEAQAPVAAANAWTRQHTSQRLEARAAGSDCLVLLIRANAKLDDAAVESIQYGAAPYDAYEGGAQQFAEDRKFRAVVYKDGSGALWTYGSITRAEAESLPLCR